MYFDSYESAEQSLFNEGWTKADSIVENEYVYIKWSKNGNMPKKSIIIISSFEVRYDNDGMKLIDPYLVYEYTFIQ